VVGLDRTIYITVYTRYLWQGNHQVYGHLWCIYTVLINPRFMPGNVAVTAPVILAFWHDTCNLCSLCPEDKCRVWTLTPHEHSCLEHSRLMHHASCLMPHASCLMPHASCLMKNHASCLMNTHALKAFPNRPDMWHLHNLPMTGYFGTDASERLNLYLRYWSGREIRLETMCITMRLGAN